MAKRVILSVIVIFIVWSAMDYVIHGRLLMSMYEQTAQFWRPWDEMKTAVMTLTTLILSTSFVLIYTLFFRDKSLLSGILYGVLFGMATGFPAAFGTYSYMPIPIALAWGWLAAMMVKSIVSGAILGAIVKEKQPSGQQPAQTPQNEQAEASDNG